MGEAARAIIENGWAKPVEPLPFREGTEVIIIALDSQDERWHLGISPSIKAMWDNPDDAIYDELYKE